MRNTGFDVHAGSVKRRSPLAGATSDRPRAMRVSSTPSRLASWATVVPWRKAAAIPLAASQSDGIPTASPPSTDSAASAAVSLLSARVSDYSSASMNRPDWDGGYHLVVYLLVESLANASPHQ